MGRKSGAMPSFFWGGELGPHLMQCRLDRGLPPYQWHLGPSSRLATIDMGLKLGGSAPFLGRGTGSPSNTKVAWAKAYLHTKWHLNPCNHLTTTDRDRNLGALPPFLRRRSWVPMSHSVARAQAYLHAKFHHDPCNHLTTIYERHKRSPKDEVDRFKVFSTKLQLVQFTYTYMQCGGNAIELLFQGGT